MPDGLPAANAFYDVSHPVRRDLHRRYIRQCLDTLGGNRNVIHLVGEEYTGPLSFVEFWIDTIREWEKETGREVTIGLGAPKDVQDAILGQPERGGAVDVIDLRYWWRRGDGSLYAPQGGKEIPGRDFESGSGQAKESPPEQIYLKVREYRDRYPDKALIDAIEGDRQQCWAFFMAGGSLLVRGQISYPDYGDPLEYVKPMDADIILPSYRFIREQLAARLPAMRPADIVLSEPERTWCLAEAGKTYFVYALHGGTIRLRLPPASENAPARWFDPRTGQLSEAQKTYADRSLTLTAPDGNDWALLIEL
jgi:hypothetical protein